MFIALVIVLKNIPGFLRVNTEHHVYDLVFGTVTSMEGAQSAVPELYTREIKNARLQMNRRAFPLFDFPCFR